MIGWSLNQDEFTLALDMNCVFWCIFLDRKVTIEDIKQVDKFRYDILIQILQAKDASTLGLVFEADLGQG